MRDECCWVGIDPGARVGMVCLALPGRATDIRKARWVGSAVVHASASTKLTAAEQKATLYERVRDQLREWMALYVVLEEPLDAAPFWSAPGRGIRGQSRGTLFLLGEHYGLCLAAAKASDFAPSIVSYPCGNHRGRAGWMATGNRKVPRAETLVGMGALARFLQAKSLSEDELMALGVLNFHLGLIWNATK